MSLHYIQMEQMPLTGTCALQKHMSARHSCVVSSSDDEASCTERTADSASDAAGQSSAPAAAPAPPPAQGNTSTQWEGPDQTKDTTTVMVCLADGTRQVSPSLAPMSLMGTYCLSSLSFVLTKFLPAVRYFGGAAGPVQAMSVQGPVGRDATRMHRLTALSSSCRRCSST